MLVFDGPMASPLTYVGLRRARSPGRAAHGLRSEERSPQRELRQLDPNPALRLAHLLASMKDDRATSWRKASTTTSCPLPRKNKT